MSSSRSQHSRFITSLKEVIQSSTEDENLEFICGSLVLFDKVYGNKHKEVLRKMINEAMMVYGPRTKFDSDERMLPVYVLLGKCSRSSSVREIFDKLHESGAYNKSAHFWITYSNLFLDEGNFKRAKDILLEGSRHKAKPIDKISQAMNDIGCTPPRVSFGMPVTSTSSHKKRSAHKALFTADKTPKQEVVPEPVVMPKEDVVESTEFVLPPLPEDVAPVLPLAPPTVSVFKQPYLPPVVPPSPRSVENGENIKPADLAFEIQPPRRRVGGILTPAQGFQLEDYDFYKDEEDEAKKRMDLEKLEKNKLNIRNNQRDEPRQADFLNCQTSVASNSSTVTHHSDAVRQLQWEEEFQTGSEALKNMNVGDSDDDDFRDNRRLTGFELRQQRRLTASMTTNTTLLNMTKSNNQRKAELEIDAIFKRMAIQSPSK